MKWLNALEEGKRKQQDEPSLATPEGDTDKENKTKSSHHKLTKQAASSSPDHSAPTKNPSFNPSHESSNTDISQAKNSKLDLVKEKEEENLVDQFKHLNNEEKRSTNRKAGRYQHLLILVMVNYLIYLSYHGVLTDFLRMFSASSHVEKFNYTYLVDAKQYTVELIKLLSESKMLVSLLQSSQVGISFFVDVQIQLGQILSTLQSVIDSGLELSIASLTSIEFLFMALEAGDFSTTPLLTASLILFGFSIAFKSRFHALASVLFNGAYSLIFIIFLAHLLIPWSIYGTAKVSESLFSHHKGEIYRGYASLHGDLPEKSHSSSLKDQAEGSITHFKKNQKRLREHTTHVTKMTAKHMMLSFIEYILLPITFLALLGLLLKSWLNAVRPDFNRK